MLFFGVLLLSLLVSCLSEEVWDPEDPRCEKERQSKKQYWDLDILGQAYSWIDRYGRKSTYNVEWLYNSNIRDFLAKGCDHYEEYKKTEYKCWSKEFLCTAKEVAKTTLDGFKMKKNYVHHEWYGWFETGRGMHQADDRDQEINWITKMRWNDPKLLYWTKNDIEELGNEMLKRIFFYIEKNNIDSLKLVFDHYQSSGTMELMKEQCRNKNSENTTMQCKLAIVFDRLAELMIDSMDIKWDPRNDRPPRTREELSMLYLLQPKVYEIMDIGSKARNKTLCHRLKTMFQSLYDNALNQDSASIKEHFGKFGSIYANVKRDCVYAYKNNFDEITCYLAETFARMDQLRSALGPDFSDWESSRSQSMRTVVLVWLLLTPKGNFFVKTTPKTRAQSAKELLKVMYQKIRENDLTGLQDIARLIPTETQMGLTISDECAPNFDKISRNMKCGFKIVLDNLALFLAQYSSKDQKAKRLDLSINYKKRLQQFQISSIKGAVENTQLELKSSLEGFTSELKQYFESSLDNRFANLRQYFETVAGYDLEIAQADAAFITGKLDEFTKTAVKLNQKLQYDGMELQFEGTLVKSIDAIFMWMKAAGSAITAVIGIMGGDFSGFADTADRVDNAAKATLEAIKGGAIRGQIRTASNCFMAIANGFKENRAQLDSTKKIVDKLKSGDMNSEEFKQIQKDFIKSYNDYTPKISQAKIAELDTAWSEIATNLENLMDSMNTKEAIIGATKSFLNNQFFKIKIVVPQLSQTLSNRFDFQFELMDSLAAMVRAHTSSQGAKGLSQGFKDLERQLAESEEAQLALDQMALSTYIISQFNLLLILSQYCNYVTYVNAGIESSHCANALKTMDTVHIDSALSYSPPSCDVVKVDLKIPTSGSGKADHINLNQLNSGEPVAFQIPNFEWLRLNGEMSDEDTESALFVKLFEIYAITNDNYKIKKNLRVQVTPAGSAPIYLVPGQIKYELVPNSRTQYVFEYKENYRGNCNSEPNPYFVCSPGPNGICVRSRGELQNDLGAYPSIYSPWTIQLNKNIGNAPNPAPGTKLYLLAKLQLCRKRADSRIDISQRRKRALKKRKKKRKKNRASRNTGAPACPVGKYFNQESGLFAACSVDSTPQHHGYYCEINKSG